MKKGQLSFEYIILFSVVLMMFVALGSIISEGVSKSNEFEKDAQMLADAIKIHVITAALSSVDYSTEFTLPRSIRSEGYKVEIHEKNDNLVLIKNERGHVVGRAFLPIIDSDPGTILINGDTILIKKDSNGLVIEKMNVQV